MANFNGTNMAKIAAGTTVPPGFANGTVRCFAETFTYAAQAAGSTLTVGKLPKGAVPLYGALSTDTSTGSATLAVGISGTAAKYKAAGAHTTVDTPVIFGKSAALNAALTAEETIIVTTAADALPATGTLTVTFFYAYD